MHPLLMNIRRGISNNNSVRFDDYGIYIYQYKPFGRMTIMPSYSSKDYALSFVEYGFVIHLAYSRGWLIKRPIADSNYYDAIGCYPIFCCQDWALLSEDLAAQDGLVSLTLVTDPFGTYDTSTLEKCFPDLVIPFKDHYVVDLSAEPDAFVHPHHKKNANKALQSLSVERVQPSDTLLAEWIGLYENLTARHHIRGMAAFSHRSFAAQFHVPGLVIFRVTIGGKCIGTVLWYLQGDTAYYHLGAYSDEGYKHKASFALFWESIQYFRRAGVRWLSLGAGAGLQPKEDGLTRFKSGWATGTRTAYLCGRIWDRVVYDKLSKRSQGTKYFPAYRAGEVNE